MPRLLADSDPHLMGRLTLHAALILMERNIAVKAKIFQPLILLQTVKTV